jgi:flagellar motility protein MotE (MotC chaperone)
MMTKLFYLIIFSIFFAPLTILGQEKSADKQEKTAEKFDDKKKYSREEFNKLVDVGITKNLKRVGEGKIVEFSRMLIKKEEKLQFRELDLEKKVEEHKENTKELEKKIKEFNQRQEGFLACLEKEDKKNQGRLSHMVDVISGMRPQEAASILSVQEAGISVKILGALPSEKVSKIFNLMDKEISARLQKQYMTMKK